MRQNIYKIDRILESGYRIPNKVQVISDKNKRNRKDLKHIPKNILVLTNTGNYDRSILLIDSINVGLDVEGSFIKNDEYSFGENWTHKYLIMSKDYLQFKKNEIVITDTIKKSIGSNRLRDICNSIGYVVTSKDNNQLYYVNFDFLNEWCYESELAKFYSIINELNITMEEVDNETLLTYNGYKCIWTPDLNERLFKKDPSVIKDMSISVKTYSKLLNNDALKLADKLMKHIKSYRALLLTYDRLDEWKKDTKACDAVLKKMRKLPFATSSFYNRQLSQKDVRLHSAIIDYVLYSKEKLGI